MVRRARLVLVGWFRSMVPAAMETPFGSQGGFGDTLAQRPYSLGNAALAAFIAADPDLQGRYEIVRIDLAEPLVIEDSREEVSVRPEDLATIEAAAPDIVGFSAVCWNLDAVARAATTLKTARPGRPILIGGKATLGDPEGLLGDIPAVDIAICGEGEIPLREILRRDLRGLDGVPGIVFRDRGGIRRGAPNAVLTDLDNIPSPYLSGLLEPTPNAMMVEWSRGCLNGCGHCTWNADKRLRWFSPERIAAEVRWAYDHGHRHITLNDSAINYDTEKLATIVAAVRRADPRGAIQFTYNIHHAHLDPRQLEILAELPTHMVLLGVETLGARGMCEVGREPVTRETLRARLGQLAAAVKPPVVSIVLGLPGDTEAGFRDTLETLLGWTTPPAIGPPAVGCVLVSLLQIFRGSKLWHHRAALGLSFQPAGIPYLLEGSTWSVAALGRAKADLIRRLGEDPERLKAAEAIVLMEAAASADPWIDPRRVAELLAPWCVGNSLGGWTLEKIGTARDTGRSILLRFAWTAGGTLRVRLDPIDSRRRSRFASERYAVSLLDQTSVAPARPCANLLHLVTAALRHGERALGEPT